jgi:hypothetical protein
MEEKKMKQLLSLAIVFSLLLTAMVAQSAPKTVLAELCANVCTS